MQKNLRLTAYGLRLVILVCSCLLSISSYAQRDSTSFKSRSYKAIYDVSYQRHDKNILSGIDTSIFQLHRNDFIKNNGAEYFHLGNSGTAAYPIIFQPNYTRGFNAGFRQFDVYRYTRDSMRYYQAQRPYTELSYVIGLNQEQIFRGRFFHSTHFGLDYGTDFFYLNSPGTYTRQTAVDAGFYLYGKYHTKNYRWNIFTDLLFNNFKVQENGGLQRDYFATDTSFFKKTLVPVYLNTAGNNYRDWKWYLGAEYHLGKKIKERVNDTLVRERVIPRFTIRYEFSIEADRYRYLDSKPDSLYYLPYGIYRDSLAVQTTLFKVGNAVSFIWQPKRVTSDSTFKEQFLSAGGTLHIDYWKAQQSLITKTAFVNGSVEGFVKSNTAFKSPIHFEGRVHYFFSGYNRNDLIVNGNVNYAWKDNLAVKVFVNYSLTEPSFTQQYFTTDSGAGWRNSFAKQNQLVAGGRVFSPKYGVGAEISNTILHNLVYYDITARPQQLSSPLNVFIVYAYNRFGIKGFHLDNDFWFQKASGSNIIRLPLFVSKHSIYYEHRIFKKVLWFALGFDVRWNSDFYANAYSPLIGQFYLQDAKKLSFLPTVDLFLNVKIKTVRVSLLGSNLGQLVSGKPNYGAYLYPIKDPSFRFFVTWRFLE